MGSPISLDFVVSSSTGSLQIEQVGNSDLKERFERMGMDWTPMETTRLHKGPTPRTGSGGRMCKGLLNRSTGIDACMY